MRSENRHPCKHWTREDNDGVQVDISSLCPERGDPSWAGEKGQAGSYLNRRFRTGEPGIDAEDCTKHLASLLV